MKFWKQSIFKTIGVGLLSSMTGMATAAEYHLLTHELYEGWVPSAEGYWGPGFDSPLAGANPLAAATFFSDAVGNFGGVAGTYYANNGGPIVYGENTFTGGTFPLETTNYFVPFFNVPSTQHFDPNLTSGFSIFPDRTATATYHMVDNFGQTSSFTGAYSWFLPTDDPADYVPAGDFLAHIDFLMSTLPANWTFFVAGLESYSFTGGPNNGVQGGLTKAAYSFDPAAVPVPLPAALPLLAVALVGVSRWRRAV